MSFRNLDKNHDWVYGSGRNDYVTELQEIALNIETKILSFLGDCFFAVNEGIDWFNLLGYRYQDKLELLVQETIKNTPGVTGINEIQILLGANRKITIQYDIQTIFSSSYQNEFQLFNYGFRAD